MALRKALGFGIERPLVSCSKENRASIKVIEANGGQLLGPVTEPHSDETLLRELRTAMFEEAPFATMNGNPANGIEVRAVRD